MDAKRGNRVDRRRRKIPVAVERRASEPPNGKPLRRPTYPGTTDIRIYDDEEQEFLLAMQRFKEQTGRRFPTWSDVLWVIRGLGYVKGIHHETDSL